MLKDVIRNIKTYSSDYIYDCHQNHFTHKSAILKEYPVEDWFSLGK
jgi:hypothetical protein